MLSSLNRVLLQKYSVYVASDNPFQQRARLLQALWREDRGYPMGTRSNDVGGSPLGSRLVRAGAEASLHNFLTPNIGRRVRREVFAPDRDHDRLFATPRIFCDLLSSQPLAFNLFAELDDDRDLATRVFRDLLPGVVDAVSHIEFEYSPGRGSTKYLANRSAFDAFVVYTTPSGRWGFVGIEVKYHEDLKGKAASMVAKPYDRIADESGVFDPSHGAALRKPPLQQIWLDHLLVLSMRQADKGWETGRFVFLAPAQNEACAEGAAAYEKSLLDLSTFCSWSIEDVHSVIARHSTAAWVQDFKHRYLDFARVERLDRVRPLAQ